LAQVFFLTFPTRAATFSPVWGIQAQWMTTVPGDATPHYGRRLCVCAISTAALAVGLWLMWPRRPKASREVALAAIRRLRAECTAVYADASAAVARAGLSAAGVGTAVAGASGGKAASPPPPLNAPPRGVGGGGGGEPKDGAAEKLREALEQPLVLEAALNEATARIASEFLPGGTPEDLQAILQHYGEESEEVRLGVEDLQAMHSLCLEGRDAPPAEVQTATELWNADQALEVLRELGREKTARLQAVLEQPGAAAREARGARAHVACAEAEDAVWERRCPGDRTRRCYFGLALQGLSKDRSFRDRRAVLERELEGLARSVRGETS